MKFFLLYFRIVSRKFKVGILIRFRSNCVRAPIITQARICPKAPNNQKEKRAPFGPAGQSATSQALVPRVACSHAMRRLLPQAINSHR